MFGYKNDLDVSLSATNPNTSNMLSSFDENVLTVFAHFSLICVAFVV